MRTTIPHWAAQSAIWAVLIFIVLSVQDTGAQWLPPVKVSDPGRYIEESPFLYAHDDSVHVIGCRWDFGGRSIVHLKSEDMGNTWGTMDWISDAYSHRPVAHGSGSSLHIIWTCYSNEDWRVLHRCSPDGGSSWGKITRITEPAALFREYAICVLEDTVHVLWIQREQSNWDLFYRKSLDGGRNWYPEKQLTFDAGHASAPNISGFGTDVHVVWTDGELPAPTTRLMHIRSTDGGDSWGEVDVLEETIKEIQISDIYVSADILHVLYNGRPQGRFEEALYKRSTDRGETWEANINLSAKKWLWEAERPCIFASGPMVHAVFCDFDTLVYLRSEDYGESWLTSSRKLASCDIYSIPSMYASGASVYIAYVSKEFFAGQDIALLRNLSGNLVSIEDGFAELIDFTLQQNYPNPFNPTTRITFSLPWESYVTLRVIDIYGREAVRLVDDIRLAGTYTVGFDGRDLSSGTYLYQLEAGGRQISRKMMLLK